jgi:flagellar secretion chaperone FliS
MWKDAYLTSRVLSADPIELVHLLYEHAIHLVQDARRSLAAGDIASRSQAISKTIPILTELETSLDHERGGSISWNLAQLYEYMRFRLTGANVKQEDGPLSEVEGLLKTLGGAWRAIRPAGDAPRPPAPADFTSYSPDRPGVGQFAEEAEVELAGHGWNA